MKMHAITLHPPQYMRAKADQHDPHGRLQRARESFGDRLADQDGCAAENEKRQRMSQPPGQAVLDDVSDIGPAGGDARDRRDMIGFQRMLHSQEKAKPEDPEHALPDSTDE